MSKYGEGKMYWTEVHSRGTLKPLCCFSFLGPEFNNQFLYTAFPLLDSQSPPKLRRIKRHISQEIKEWDEETDQEEGHSPEELTWGFMEDAKADHKPGHIML